MESAAVQSILTKIVDHTVMPEADRAALALAIVDLDPSTVPAPAEPASSGVNVPLGTVAPTASPNDPNAPGLTSTSKVDTLDSRESRDAKRAALMAQLESLDAEDTSDDYSSTSNPHPSVSL